MLGVTPYLHRRISPDYLRQRENGDQPANGGHIDLMPTPRGRENIAEQNGGAIVVWSSGRDIH